MKNSIVHIRVSSTKQADQGESLEVQEKICCDLSKQRGYKVVKLFKEPYSGRKDDRPVLESLFDYLKKHPGKIDAVFIRDIDRFTRGGAYSYNDYKRRLTKFGVEIIDTTGIIQPVQNTLADVGFEYDWSLRSPSKIAENIKADVANDEITTILTRMLGQEIRNVNQGFSVRAAPMGFENIKVEDENGKKKTVLAPHPIEAPWFETMFKLRAEGILTDPEICERVNAMGFKTRITKLRDRMTRKVIGTRGGKELTPGKLQDYVTRPIYCGIIIEKWTRNLPVKAQYDGLVDIDTFNRASRGKVKIIEEPNGNIVALYDAQKQQRLKENPDYPYRFVLRCNKCGKTPLKGSASRGKMGKHYPAYHCDKGHYYRVSVDKMHKALEDYLKKLRFKPVFLNLFEAVAIDTWRMKQKDAVSTLVSAEENVTKLRKKQEHLLEEYTKTESETVKNLLTKKLEDIETEIANASDVRTKHEIDEQKIQAYIARAKYVVEHPSELLLNSTSMLSMKQMWGFVFEELPTYEELVGGTPKLSLVFELARDSKRTKNQLAAKVGRNSHFFCRAT